MGLLTPCVDAITYPLGIGVSNLWATFLARFAAIHLLGNVDPTGFLSSVPVQLLAFAALLLPGSPGRDRTSPS